MDGDLISEISEVLVVLEEIIKLHQLHQLIQLQPVETHGVVTVIHGVLHQPVTTIHGEDGIQLQLQPVEIHGVVICGLHQPVSCSSSMGSKF